LFVLLAVIGLWVGAQLARLDQNARPVPRATPSVAWENGGVVIHDPPEQTAAVPDP
jgi:energy-converting hydrogenase Eha subunit F